jgi:phosphate transport system permease protein
MNTPPASKLAAEGFTVRRAARPVWSIMGERALESLIYLCGISAIIFVLGIFFFVFKEALPVLGSKHFNLSEFLFSQQWYPTSEIHKRYGVLAMIVGTLSVTGLAVLIAVPFGLGAAIYLSEFCSGRMKETLKVIIELLAAIPSVVWGFIGLTVMSRLIVKYTGAPVGVNMLNGGIILALMILPIIVSLSEDALKAVPDSYREAGLALGATRWQLAWRVLLPAAKTGLLAAVLLGIGRGVGETMAVLMATGHAVQIPHSILDSVRTLTANIAAELGEAPANSAHYRVLFLTGVLLFLMTFIVNLAADLIVRGIRPGAPWSRRKAAVLERRLAAGAQTASLPRDEGTERHPVHADGAMPSAPGVTRTTTPGGDTVRTQPASEI